jgi:hypothetical protein
MIPQVRCRATTCSMSSPRRSGISMRGVICGRWHIFRTGRRHRKSFTEPASGTTSSLNLTCIFGRGPSRKPHAFAKDRSSWSCANTVSTSNGKAPVRTKHLPNRDVRMSKKARQRPSRCLTLIGMPWQNKRRRIFLPLRSNRPSESAHDPEPLLQARTAGAINAMSVTRARREAMPDVLPRTTHRRPGNTPRLRPLYKVHHQTGGPWPVSRFVVFPEVCIPPSRPCRSKTSSGARVASSMLRGHQKPRRPLSLQGSA